MPFLRYRPQKQWGVYNTQIFKEILKARNKRAMAPPSAPAWALARAQDPLDPTFFKQFEHENTARMMEKPPAKLGTEQRRKLEEQMHPLYKQQQCFLFDGTASMTDGIAQACALLKVAEPEKLPAAIHTSLPADFLPTDFEQHVADCIMAGERFDPSLEKLPKKYDPILFWIYQKAHYGTPVLKRNNIILQNLCRKVALFSMRSESKVLEDLRCDYDEPISALLDATDSGIGMPLVFRHQPHLILQSEQPLARLADEEEVEDTRNETVPDIYPITPLIDLSRTNIYNDTAVLPRLALSQQLHVNTVLWAREQSQQYPWTIEENAANTICHCFGAALAQALRRLQTLEFLDGNGTGKKDKILRTPIVAKGVQLVGGKLDLALVQLNTLNLANSRGVKNMVWLDKACPLYKPKPMHQNMDAVEELSVETARKLMAFLLYR